MEAEAFCAFQAKKTLLICFGPFLAIFEPWKLLEVPLVVIHKKKHPKKK